MISDLLTIVIPTRDRPELLERCLRSVFDDQPVTPQVIVSDNSTRDFDAIEPVRQRYGFSYVRRSGAMSMRDHHNASLSLAQTPWALLLHDDDELYPESLKKLEELLSQRPSAGVIVCGFQRIDEHSVAHASWTPEKMEMLTGEEAVLRLGLDYMAHPPSTVYNVGAFHSAGGFPDAFGASADYPLILQLTYSQGVLFFPEIVGRYRVGAQQSTDFTVKGAERTLDETIRMSELTRAIGVSSTAADRLVDYNTWWIFRIIAARCFTAHPFFIARMFRKCLRTTPANGDWKDRIRDEYPLLFFRPAWLFILLYQATRRYVPACLKRILWSRPRVSRG
jgi:glycosyltransferase involved in cell wall biosynthesis